MPAISLFLLISLLTIASSRLIDRASCSGDYSQCAPDGATLRDVPALGGDWAFFYQAMVSSVPSSPDTDTPPSNSPDGGTVGPVRRQANMLCCESIFQDFLNDTDASRCPEYALHTCEELSDPHLLCETLRRAYGTIADDPIGQVHNQLLSP